MRAAKKWAVRPKTHRPIPLFFLLQKLTEAVAKKVRPKKS